MYGSLYHEVPLRKKVIRIMTAAVMIATTMAVRCCRVKPF